MSHTYEEVAEELKKQQIEISSKSLVPKAPGLLMVVSGPSGVGKDAVVQELNGVYKKKEVDPELNGTDAEKKSDRELKFIVTATTRERRQNEIDKKDYHFVSKETFEEWIENDKLYEYSLVYGHYKGVPKEHISKELDSGHDCILRLDVKGVATMKRLRPECISVFIAPHSQQALIRRLISRQTESMEELISRIKSSKEEMKCMEEEDIFDYVLKNEGELKDTALKLYEILTVERMRRSRLFRKNKDKRNNS